MRLPELKICVLCSALMLALPAFSQELPSEGPVETKALIAIESKKDAPIDPKQMKLEVAGRETPLLSLSRVQPSSLQLAILIDDGLRTSFDLQLRDLKAFISSLPPGVQVSVGYMRNGTVMGTGPFTNDHIAAAAALRIPVATPGISASPYFCLSEYVKQWPSQEPAARVVLMFTNGVDPYNGSVSALNQDSPYVQAAQDDAQRAGVAVYAIAYGDAGMRGQAASFSGQNYLEQVAVATGGQSLYQGSFNPVSITPFLEQFRKAISESYTARFMAASSHEKARTLVQLKLRSSQPGVKIHAPESVHPGLD